MKEGWEYKKLGEIATEMYRGSGIKRDQVTKEGTPCVRYGEIYTTYNISFDTCASHTKKEYITSPKYFEHGDLLFAITGESVEDIGKTIAYLGDEKCLCGGDIICMKHRQNPKFLAYALSTPDAIRQKGIGKTKLKVVHTNAPALKAISIPLAPLSEQQRIVDYLDSAFAKIDAMKANAEKSLNEAKALFQASLKEMLEPKEGWEEKKLGEIICHLRTGLNPRTHFKLNTPDAEGYYITVRELKGFTIEPDEKTDKVNSAAIKRINERSNLKIGDVLFSGTGTIGKTALVSELPRNWNIKEGVYAMTPKHSVLDSRWFIYYIGSEFFLRLVNDKAAGAGVRSIPMKALIKLPVFIPSLSEQQSIVETLDSLKSKIDRLQENYDKISHECDALKQAILRQVFD